MLFVAFLLCALKSVASVNDSLQFPEYFKFGAASSAYQVEGAWNEDGKGESIWDRWFHEEPNATADGQNGDVACDSYHRYKEDVQMLKTVGMDFYRFSLSWPRILPDGDISNINQAGIEYYENLIDELLANGIEPVVTIFHWDLPWKLQEIGGFANDAIALFFKDYADLVFKKYGDKVKWWVTLNEPQEFCGAFASQFISNAMHGFNEYLCGRTLLLAHMHAYHLYNNKYRPQQKGKIGIALNTAWYEPKTNSQADIEAAERDIQFWLGWFAHPIYSLEGNYPRVMRERIAANSAKEGLSISRLPEFSLEELALIRGSADFFGLNHYTTTLSENGERGLDPSRDRDAGTIQSADPSWPDSGAEWLKVVPWGFRKLLNWIKDRYRNPSILVTENGYADRGTLNDTGRIVYYQGYMAEMLKAIKEDGVDVIGHTSWSLMDNLEWTSGYTVKFGMYNVNFQDPNRTRTPKSSTEFFKMLTQRRVIPTD